MFDAAVSFVTAETMTPSNSTVHATSHVRRSCLLPVRETQTLAQAVDRPRFQRAQRASLLRNAVSRFMLFYASVISRGDAGQQGLPMA